MNSALLVAFLFLRLRGFWENDRPFIPRLRFFFFFEVEINSRSLIPLRARISQQWLSELRRL